MFMISYYSLLVVSSVDADTDAFWFQVVSVSLSDSRIF